MRLSRRTEFVLDTEMQLLLAEGEPDAAALGEIRRLLQFRQTEDAGVEPARLGFRPARYRQLDMVQPQN